MLLKRMVFRSVIGVPAVSLALLLASCSKDASNESTQPNEAPPVTTTSSSLTVQLTQPRQEDWRKVLSAHGPIAAWQESMVGAEVGGVRITQVLVNVGDSVRKGQALAVLRSENLQADVQASKAALNEARTALSEISSNVVRARQLRDSGFISAQEMERTENQEKTAKARIDSLTAQLAVSNLRLSQAQVLAPVDGIVSVRKAVAGMSPQAGEELFRLIVQSRLEWQAEVAAVDLAALKTGLQVSLTAPGIQEISGVVRAVSPSVDPRTRQGTVYVDLPVQGAQKAGFRAGMFASGQFNLASTPALTLPVTAVQLRDGFNVVFEVKQNKVYLHHVELGRRLGDRVEIVSGINQDSQIVLSGVGFLNDGDTVKVVASAAASE